LLFRWKLRSLNQTRLCIPLLLFQRDLSQINSQIKSCLKNNIKSLNKLLDSFSWSFRLKLLSITERISLNKQHLIWVKVDRVFSSCFNKKESSPPFQIHKIRRKESQWVVTGFMQVFNQKTRNFATLQSSGIRLLLARFYKKAKQFFFQFSSI
jgi:hypothetical protein